MYRIQITSEFWQESFYPNFMHFLINTKIAKLQNVFEMFEATASSS